MGQMEYLVLKSISTDEYLCYDSELGVFYNSVDGTDACQFGCMHNINEIARRINLPHKKHSILRGEYAVCFARKTVSISNECDRVTI